MCHEKQCLRCHLDAVRESGMWLQFVCHMPDSVWTEKAQTELPDILGQRLVGLAFSCHSSYRTKSLTLELTSLDYSNNKQCSYT